MKRVSCTWGDGPDVFLSLEDDVFVLYEEPKHTKPPQGDYTHGYVTKGFTNLTADEALALADDLTEAAKQAKELDSICKDLDKLESEKKRISKYVNYPLSEKEMEEINMDYPLEALTCYECSHRGTCKYVDDLYNTDGDCLALK